MYGGGGGYCFVRGYFGYFSLCCVIEWELCCVFVIDGVCVDDLGCVEGDG